MDFFPSPSFHINILHLSQVDKNVHQTNGIFWSPKSRKDLDLLKR